MEYGVDALVAHDEDQIAELGRVEEGLHGLAHVRCVRRGHLLHVVGLHPIPHIPHIPHAHDTRHTHMARHARTSSQRPRRGRRERWWRPTSRRNTSARLWP
jgi:hypothetical protein